MKLAALAASGWVVVLAGCGLAANPQPPTLWLPQPVKDLQASRVGNDVRLTWMMPRHTTDKVELQGPQQAVICRMRPQGGRAIFRGKDCRNVGQASYAPDKPAEFVAPLPASLAAGAPQPLTYFVELQSPAGKTAGPSNAAWTAAGSAPAAAAGLRLRTAPDGVILHWIPAPPEPGLVMRIHRRLIPQKGAPKPNANMGVSPPKEQTLEVNLSRTDSGGAVDRDAALDHVYRYWIERVLRVKLDGHKLEIAGIPSGKETIDAKDVFPPPVPKGLVALPDEQSHSIDLSWQPDTESSLAGYFVYRQDLTSGTGMRRISGKTPLVAPSLDDRSVVPGHEYAYRVSAIDADGNESAKSAPVKEQLRQ